MITKNTAMDIALAYREIETAEKLLADITESLRRHDMPDIRDAFGRQSGGLQLGVPHGQSVHTLYNVPWTLAKPIIEAHIAHHRSLIGALNAKALIEAGEQS